MVDKVNVAWASFILPRDKRDTCTQGVPVDVHDLGLQLISFLDRIIYERQASGNTSIKAVPCNPGRQFSPHGNLELLTARFSPGDDRMEMSGHHLCDEDPHPRLKGSYGQEIKNAVFILPVREYRRDIAPVRIDVGTIPDGGISTGIKLPEPGAVRELRHTCHHDHAIINPIVRACPDLAAEMPGSVSSVAPTKIGKTIRRMKLSTVNCRNMPCNASRRRFPQRTRYKNASK